MSGTIETSWTSSVDPVELIPMITLVSVVGVVVMFLRISNSISCIASFTIIVLSCDVPSKYPDAIKTSAITNAPTTKSNVLRFVGVLQFVTSVSLDLIVLSSPLESSMSVAIGY